MSTLEHRLRAIDEALAAGDLPAAREALARALELDRDHPDVVYAQACVEWEADGPEAASRSLTRTLEIDPSHADAHYGLARVLELQGDRPAMIQHLLRVHALDARADRAARIGGRRDLDHVEGVARDVLSALPGPFAERLRHVPVILEARPSRALVATGFDPRALGLFEGPTEGDMHTAAPTRIVLYVNNLLADFPEEPLLGEQIEITLLHEIGHFFNLDEDDMTRLGLE